MKKVLLILLSVFLIFCGCGCTSKNTTSAPSIETQYYNYAKECIEKEDIQKAEQVLKEGIEKTKSKNLQELLDSISSNSETGTSSDNDSSNISSNTESDADSAISEKTNSSQTESASGIVPLANTYWRLYDSFTGRIYQLHFKNESTLEYSYGDSGYYDEYNYQYNGKQLVLKYYLESDEAYYTDTYFVKFISLADNTKITSRTDKMQLEGSGFLAGYWECDGLN